MPSAPYDVETLSGDLERVREALGIEQLHLVGHSLGGMVAQQYALRRPERLCSLVLASTSNHNGRRASLLARVMARLCAEGFDVAMAEARADTDRIANQDAPPTFENTIVAMERAGKPIERAFTYYGIWAANLSSPEFREVQGRLARIRLDYMETDARVAPNETVSATFTADKLGVYWYTVPGFATHCTWRCGGRLIIS